MKRLAVALLFLSAPAWAQDEVLSPTATIAESNSSCTTGSSACPSGTEAHCILDDDPDSPGGDWCTSDTCAANPTNDSRWHMSFDTPASSPSTGTNAQTFAAYVRSCQSGGTDPTCRLDLYCNSSLIESGSNQTITSSTGQLITEDFTFGGTCTSDGSDVEVDLYCAASGGTPSSRRTGEADAVEWRVTYVPSAPTSTASRYFDGNDADRDPFGHSFPVGTDDLTVGGWYKFDVVNATQGLLCVTSNNGWCEIGFYFDSSNAVGTRRNDQTSTSVGCLTTDTTFSTDTWYHIGFTSKYSDGVTQVYVNGVADTTSCNFTDNVSLDYTTCGSIYHGISTFSSCNTESSGYLQGNVADVRVYDRLLTAAEMLEMASGRQPPNPRNLTEWYPYNGTTDDKGPNGDDIETVDSVASADGPPVFWAGGN